MSKAFTRETDDSPDDNLSPPPALPPGVQNYITPEGAQRLQSLLTHLSEQKRLAIESQSATDAAESGEIRKLENRLRQLQQTLNSIVVTPPSGKNPDRVAFGSTVIVRQANGTQIIYRIVGVEEMDLDRGHISWRSPLARALLSRRPGDEVRFAAPGGTQTLHIVEVRPE